MRLPFGLLSLVALAVTAQDTSVTTVKQAFDDANVRAFVGLSTEVFDGDLCL
jgi:hypothetical protein